MTEMGREDNIMIRNTVVVTELLEMLAESAEDVKNGRVIPMEEAFDDIRAALKEGQS